MGIRTKIMLGFVILASMLFISGSISIYEITKLGKAIKGLINDNYRSIDYSRIMLDALDQQENAMLLFAEGDSIKGKKIFSEANITFLLYLDSASTNLSVPDEIAFVDSVKYHFNRFQSYAKPYTNGKPLKLSEYLKDIYPLVKTTSENVKNLITINQKGLFRSAAFLETSAQRASMPGLIVIITSLIFTLVFTYLINHYFVLPIIKLTKGINDFVKFRKHFDVSVESKDELLSLRESIANLISTIKSISKKVE